MNRFMAAHGIKPVIDHEVPFEQPKPPTVNSAQGGTSAKLSLRIIGVQMTKAFTLTCWA